MRIVRNPERGDKLNAWNFQDLAGQRFGNLTVIERAENSKDGGAKWLCKCDCGNETVVKAGNLKSGHARSCNCLKKEKHIAIHGQTGTRIYREWQDMKKRCYNPKRQSYKTHGARGITVCDEWLHDFKAFYDWALANGYSDSLTIDRKDVNGNYEPSNCRWATAKEQANNTRRNHLITYSGKTQTLQQWADEIGISRQVIERRIARGWGTEKALSTPKKIKASHGRA